MLDDLIGQRLEGSPRAYENSRRTHLLIALPDGDLHLYVLATEGVCPGDPESPGDIRRVRKRPVRATAACLGLSQALVDKFRYA